MLFYLGHTRPEIVFAVHRCERYTLESKQPHEAALRHIGRYLKETLSMGLILDSDDN